MKKIEKKHFTVHRHDVVENVVLLIFNSQYEMTHTMLRMQEYYESPEFHGTIFTVEEFKAWYMTSHPRSIKSGEFSYYTDWGGFNIPPGTLTPFLEGKFDPLDEWEVEFLELFEQDKPEELYIIAAFPKETIMHTFEHELAHALYFFDEEYRAKAQQILKEFDTSDMEKYLRSLGSYGDVTIIDELHAQSIDILYTKKREEVGYVGPSPELRDKMRANFLQYLIKNSANIPDLKEFEK